MERLRVVKKRKQFRISLINMRVRNKLRSHKLIKNTKFKFLNLNKEELIVIFSLTYYVLALTKKLLEKVKKEWDDSLKKKEEELEEEKV